MTRPSRALVVVSSALVVAVLVTFFGVIHASSAGSSDVQTGLIPPPHSTLVAEIGAVNTSWNGPEPICAGGAGELVTSFVGNASGGTPPYTYLWNFGDGSPPSTEQNPTHLYSWNVSDYLVTLTVTDSAGLSGEAGTIVAEPGFFCPPNPLPPALPSLFGIPALAVPTAIVAVGVAITVVRMSWGGSGRPPDTG